MHNRVASPPQGWSFESVFAGECTAAWHLGFALVLYLSTRSDAWHLGFTLIRGLHQVPLGKHGTAAWHLCFRVGVWHPGLFSIRAD